MASRRARRSAAETWQLIPAAKCRPKSGCKDAFDLPLFFCLALRRSQYLRHQCSAGFPPSARSACPHRARRNRKAAQPSTDVQSLRAPLAVVGADALIGPLRRLSSTTGQRQRKEKQLNAMTTPTRSAPSATGRQQQESQKSIACPKASPNRSRHRYANPRCARRVTAPERVQAAFSFGPCTARFLFGKTEKKMGGALPSYQHS